MFSQTQDLFSQLVEQMKQGELFEKYYNAANEMNSISEVVAFKYGFKLAIELLNKSSK